MLQAHSAGDLWVGQRNLWFSGVRLRARMTVIRLADGALWLHSPHAPTDELCAELDRLGEVRWIVVPNRYHHLHAAATKARYPSAQVIGPASVIERNKAVVLDAPLEATAVPGITAVALGGVPFLDETLFLHSQTGTLIGTDIMMCGCAADHFTWRWASRLFGQYGRYKPPPDVRKHASPSPELAASLAVLAKLPVERMFVAHSDPIEDRPLEQLAAAWQFATSAA